MTLSPYLLNPNVPRVAGADNSAAFSFFPGTACASYTQLESGGCAYSDPTKQIQPETENVNILASYTQKLGGDWRADVKASMFESRVKINQSLTSFPSSYGSQLELMSGVPPHYIPNSAIPAIRIPASYPGNPFGVPAIVRGPVPGAPESYITTESRAYRLAADFAAALVPGAWPHIAILLIGGLAGLTTWIAGLALRRHDLRHASPTPQQSDRVPHPSTIASGRYELHPGHP